MNYYIEKSLLEDFHQIETLVHAFNLKCYNAYIFSANAKYTKPVTR